MSKMHRQQGVGQLLTASDQVSDVSDLTIEMLLYLCCTCLMYNSQST